MKIKILNTLSLVNLFLLPSIIYAQAPNLGTAANFVLFSRNGAVTNSGISHYTGNIGTNNGSSTGFGNVDGVMHDGDTASINASAAVLTAYNQLNGTTPTFFPAPGLGNGDTLVPGVYSISGASTINLNLFLNGQGNANSVFIFKIQGSLSTFAAAKVKLINGALACNVFWKVEGLVSLATKTAMKGTIIANNAAINMNTLDTLEGRAFSTTGAVTADGILAYTPIGCGSAILNGPVPPALASTACYAIFSADGAVSNSGITHITGDVGTNTGLTTGFDSSYVTGTIHSIPDASTAQCAADLTVVYNYLSALPYDIELLYPAQFGNDLVLTPHTYLLNAATVFTDTLWLNAEGNPNATFIFKIYGALSTSTYSTVMLVNGAQVKNVYWLINGAVGINNYSVFCGTMVVNNGALGALNTGVTINGRALTTTGALTTTAITARITSVCSITEITSNTAANMPVVTAAPNPFSTSITFNLTGAGNISNCELIIYNALGAEVARKSIQQQSTTIETNNFSSGIYFYKVIGDSQTLKTGRLICQ
ncbi:MAG: hypothetical protein JWO06_3963 [Bacteroidota bacterium]|nr:hypothetical protein [Bacteroidota bacterium]